MPIPSPKGEEKQEDFVARCMKDLNSDYPDEQQRAAICYKAWSGKTDSKQASAKTLKYFDALAIDNAKWYEDADGNVRVPVIIAKAGVLTYKYVDQNGDSVELREAKLPEELLSKHTLFSAEGKPVTSEHPPVMLNSTNYSQYSKGTFINPRIIGDSIHGEIVIYDKELQNDIRNGTRYQVSPGFWSSTEYKAGKYNNDSFDAIQRDISINHIAIVKEGRAGESVRVKLDSADIVKIRKEVKDMPTPEEQRKMDEYNAALEKEKETPATDADPEMKSEDKPATDADPEAPAEEPKKDQMSPEEMATMIEQLQKENELLKSQLTKTDSVGAYMEARDFALKYITDKPVNAYSQSAQYYKRMVVDHAGLSTANLTVPQLEGAYSVAKIMLAKQDGKAIVEQKMDDAAQSELEKALKIARENNPFTGKRKVG